MSDRRGRALSRIGGRCAIWGSAGAGRVRLPAGDARRVGRQSRKRRKVRNASRCREPGGKYRACDRMRMVGPILMIYFADAVRHRSICHMNVIALVMIMAVS